MISAAASGDGVERCGIGIVTEVFGAARSGRPGFSGPFPQPTTDSSKTPDANIPLMQGMARRKVRVSIDKVFSSR
jgi:hypothetical protein